MLNLVDSEGIYSYRIVYIALLAAVNSSLSGTCDKGYLRPTPWVCTRGSANDHAAVLRLPGIDFVLADSPFTGQVINCARTLYLLQRIR